MSLAQIIGYSEQVPNWAPPERFLPNADYGRVGALKLAENLFTDKILQYCSASNTEPWGIAGQYHFYLLGRKLATRRNEFTRVKLNAKPEADTFKFGNFLIGVESFGPTYFRNVIEEITEAARIYGFSPQTLVSAILTLADATMITVPANANSKTDPNFKEGFNMALSNFGVLESLWGIRSSGYPQTYRKTPAGGFAARKDYGGFSKGRRGKKKRRRYR
jgi:hypothetical protein